MYCSLARLSYNVGCFLIIIPMFIGHFKMGKYLMSTSIMRAVGKLTFLIAVTLPIIVGFLNDTVQDSIFMGYNVVMFLGLGNVTCSLFWSFIS